MRDELTVRPAPRSRFWLALVQRSAAVLLLLLVGCRGAAEGPAQPATAPPATAPAGAAAAAPSSAPADPVEALLAQMSLAEKVGQMTLVEKNSISPDEVTAHFIGGVLSGGGGYPRPNTPEAWLEMVDSYAAAARATRLGIPLLYGVDAVHGHNNVRGATIFPHNVGLGATRNPELVEQIGRATAVEVAATGIYWNYAPAVTVPQDIRWGRTYEGYSESTAVVTELGVAYLRGLQAGPGGDGGAGERSPTLFLLATPKHYIGDGGTSWGSSRTGDYKLDQGDTQVDEATLRAVHLPPYQAVIDAGALSIMVSYSSWNGEKLHAQRYLLTDVLKEELGFDGFLVSDWEAIDQISPNYDDAVVAAINAGVDMNMVPYNYDRFITTLTRAVEQGAVSQERIDDAVRRILRAKLALGLWPGPQAGRPAAPDPSQLALVGAAEHRALAREAVRQSLVLLKNGPRAGGNGDGPGPRRALPLDKNTPLIFVGGVAADDIGTQSGGWTIEWQGRPGNITPGVTILEGLEAALGPNGDIQFNRFGNFESRLDAAGQPLVADVGIAVVGERPYAEGRGDSDQLYLSDADLAVIDRLRAQSEILVVILLSGRPLIINEALAQADAFVAAWLPGSEGDGVADVLFGDYPFTGRLPFSWPRTMAQLPFDFANLPESGCDAPLFPFGYGLDAAGQLAGGAPAEELIACE